MALDRRLWIPLYIAICMVLMVFFAYRSLTSGPPKQDPASLDCSGPISSQPVGCFR